VLKALKSNLNTQ